MKTQITFTITDPEFRHLIGEAIEREVRYSGPNLYKHRLLTVAAINVEGRGPISWQVIYEPAPEVPDEPEGTPVAEPAAD